MRYPMPCLSVLFAAATTFAAAALPAQGPGGSVRTWSGAAGNGQWGDPANWGPPGSPQPVPGANDKAIVGPDAGTITGKLIDVHELVVQDSANGNPADNTVIQGDPDLQLKFGAGGAYNGSGCTIQGADGTDGTATVAGPPPVPGTDGTRGGNLRITGPGTFVNRGTNRGGDGGDGPDLQETRGGGSATIEVGGFDNAGGKNRGGHGGNKVGRPGPCCGGKNGGDGGNCTVRTTPGHPSNKPGTNERGNGGSYTPGGDGLFHGQQGRPGRVSLQGFASMLPGDRLSGGPIGMRSAQPLDLRQCTAGAFVAVGAPIRIEAPSIDLRQIAAGTAVFQAEHVFFAGALLLDVGVAIQDLCGTAQVHVGPHAAAEQSLVILPNERFDGCGPNAPVGWNATVQQGSTGFRFDNPSAIPLHPNMGCNAALVTANLNAGGPLHCSLESPLMLGGAPSGPVVLEWSQWYVPGPGGHVDVFVVQNGVPTPIFGTAAATPSWQWQHIDITPLLLTAPTFSIRFSFTGSNLGHWAIDEVGLRVVEGSLPGTPAIPGLAVLDVNDARNANNEPVHLGRPGPFDTSVHVGDLAIATMTTAPNQFAILFPGAVLPGSLSLPGIGQVDLDPLFLTDPLGTFFTGPLGTTSLPFLVPPTFSGLTLGLQAAVTTPGGGLTVTNAVEVRFGP